MAGSQSRVYALAATSCLAWGLAVWVVCRGCKETINSNRKVCPHCGVPIPRWWEKVGKVLIVVIACMVPAYFVMAALKKPPAPPAQTDEQKQAIEAEQARYQADLAAVCAFRQAHKSPESIKLVKVVRMASGELCVHYTSVNSFGSAVGERLIVPPLALGKPQRTSTCDGVAGKEQTAAISRGLANCPG